MKAWTRDNRIKPNKDDDAAQMKTGEDGRLLACCFLLCTISWCGQTPSVILKTKKQQGRLPVSEKNNRERAPLGCFFFCLPVPLFVSPQTSLCKLHVAEHPSSFPCGSAAWGSDFKRKIAGQEWVTQPLFPPLYFWFGRRLFNTVCQHWQTVHPPPLYRLVLPCAQRST